MDKYFDVIYYSLSIAIVVISGFTILRGIQHKAVSKNGVRLTFGSALCAAGMMGALLGGLFADLFLKQTSYFQQVRFLLYYSGFTVILYGATLMVRELFRLYSRKSKALIRCIWLLFGTSVLIAAFFLFDPMTFVLNSRGEQVQLVVYWLPLFVSAFLTAFAVLFSAVVLDKQQAVQVQRRTILVALFAVFVFIGLLRESTILPDLGDPLVNMLVSFVPFTIASVCLAIATL